MKGVDAAVDYYANDRKEDYYLNGIDKHGFWFGGAAEKMGLLGHEVKRETFRNLLNGFAPDGRQELVQNAGDSNRDACWDMTFNAPKDLSVIWGMSAPNTRRVIEQILQDSVKVTLVKAEEVAGITRRGPGGKIKEPARLIWALFQEGTSRAQDMHLHLHAVLANIGLRRDGSFGSIYTPNLFRWKIALGSIFQSEVAARLNRRLGMVIESREVGFGIRGVLAELRQQFSKRRQTIVRVMTERKLTGAIAAKTVAKETRPRKEEVSPDRLFPHWRQAGMALGWDPEQTMNFAHAGREHSLTADQLDKLVRETVRAIPEHKQTRSKMVLAATRVALEQGADGDKLFQTLTHLRRADGQAVLWRPWVPDQTAPRQGPTMEQGFPQRAQQANRLDEKSGRRNGPNQSAGRDRPPAIPREVKPAGPHNGSSQGEQTRAADHEPWRAKPERPDRKIRAVVGQPPAKEDGRDNTGEQAHGGTEAASPEPPGEWTLTHASEVEKRTGGQPKTSGWLPEEKPPSDSSPLLPPGEERLIRQAQTPTGEQPRPNGPGPSHGKPAQHRSPGSLSGENNHKHSSEPGHSTGKNGSTPPNDGPNVQPGAKQTRSRTGGPAGKKERTRAAGRQSAQAQRDRAKQADSTQSLARQANHGGRSEQTDTRGDRQNSGRDAGQKPQNPGMAGPQGDRKSQSRTTRGTAFQWRKFVHIRWTALYSKPPWVPEKEQFFHIGHTQPFEHAPWDRAKSFQLPVVRVELPGLAFGPRKAFQARWGSIRWKKNLKLLEVRIQNRILFRKAPKWNPLHGIAVPALRFTLKKSKWEQMNRAQKQTKRSKQESKSQEHGHSH